MLRLNEAQRRVVTDKVPDLANLAAGAMVFGQFLADEPFSALVAAGGLVIWAFLMGCTVVLARGAEQ